MSSFECRTAARAWEQVRVMRAALQDERTSRAWLEEQEPGVEGFLTGVLSVWRCRQPVRLPWPPDLELAPADPVWLKEWGG